VWCKALGEISRSRKLLTNKKRKVLDMANKKRKNAPCFEVGYVSSSFLHGSVLW
jgi:hypothetical protein